MRSDAYAIARLAREACAPARVTTFRAVRASDVTPGALVAEVSIRFDDRETAERFAALVNAQRVEG